MNEKKKYEHFLKNLKSTDLNLPGSFRLSQWSNVFKFGAMQKYRPEELIEVNSGNGGKYSKMLCEESVNKKKSESVVKGLRKWWFLFFKLKNHEINIFN